MSSGIRLCDIFNKKSTMLVSLGFSVAILFGIELLIFIAFSSTSGQKPVIEIRDKSGHVVSRTVGSLVDRGYLESKFGNLNNYDVEVSTIDKPFPVRAWISASVGVPVVLILLVAYLVKVYLHLLDGGETQSESHSLVTGGHVFPFFVTAILNRYFVFFLGVLIALGALLFWMVPNLLRELAGLTVETVRQAKWIVLAPLGGLVCFFLWISFLRYRLSVKLMEHQFRLEKYRLERDPDSTHRLPSDMPDPGGLERRNDDALPPIS